MRLCGISSGFPLLSPGIRQVAHALLTRPPLGRGSLGFTAPPFDLHVLGTPPAFILSQDQTLMFNSVRQIPIWLTVFSGSGPPFWLPVLADFSQSLCPLNYPLFGESPGLRPSLPPAPAGLLFGIFRVALLFVCQGSRSTRTAAAIPENDTEYSIANYTCQHQNQIFLNFFYNFV